MMDDSMDMDCDNEFMIADTPDHRAARRQKRWDVPMGGMIDFGISTLASEKALDPESCGTAE